MLWFSKGKGEREEVWDEHIEWPIGDIEAGRRIRVICRSAADSAMRIGSLSNGAHNKKSDNNKNKHATERYQRAARAAMLIATKISDDLLRDSAMREMVGLCLKANDTNTARPLFRAIHAVSIREDVLKDHPALRNEQQRAALPII
ncbi:MAG: hypothetical protein ACJ8EE_13655 [Bradyrhizobium sp.]